MKLLPVEIQWFQFSTNRFEIESADHMIKIMLQLKCSAFSKSRRCPSKDRFWPFTAIRDVENLTNPIAAFCRIAEVRLMSLCIAANGRGADYQTKLLPLPD